LLQHDNAPFHIPFFTKEFFFTKNMNVVTHPPCFSLSPRLKIKLKACHFDTIEVIEAELQTMLNTLTEHDFQVALKMVEALGTVHTRGRELL
jgi:hypothetical protein